MYVASHNFLDIGDNISAVYQLLPPKSSLFQWMPFRALTKFVHGSGGKTNWFHLWRMRSLHSSPWVWLPSRPSEVRPK